MKTATILIAAIAIITCSCGRSKVEPPTDCMLENGFGYGLHGSNTPSMNRVAWADCFYLDSNTNRIVVWPILYEVASIQISNNLVVLLGFQNVSPRSGHGDVNRRMIAFKAPSGPPMDITDQVMRNWQAQSGVPTADILRNGFVGLEKTNDAVRLRFTYFNRGLRGPNSIDAAGGHAIITWSEIEAIMQDVKKNGVLKKESWSGMEFLQVE